MSRYYFGERVVRSTLRGATCWTYRWQEKIPRWAFGQFYIRRAKGRGLIWARAGESFADAVMRRDLAEAAS